MFKAIPFDYSTAIKVEYKNETVEMFHIIVDATDDTVVWQGSWEQWAKDTVKAIFTHTDYIMEPWNFITVYAVDVEKEQYGCCHVITFYQDSQGELQTERVRIEIL